MYCSFLQELGIELKVPQLTIATAMMFCHRFYMRQSHARTIGSGCFLQTIASVCMFLACKSEETPRCLNEFVVVAYKLIYKWDPSASRRIREIYDKQKQLILIGERLLLHALAFDMNIEHPYNVPPLQRNRL
ncbi:putative cyclin [Helianthus debilis subsp. tardiflorus]